ncbi:MAG: signal peptidase I [Clostridia bacterium]|nr:signal peptidase I [Clostridia bacterium]
MKINPKLKKVFTFAAYVFTAIFILLVAIVLYFNLTGKTFFVFDRAVMWVKTGSMEPEIPAKSYIIVKKATGDDVKLGDVIVFHSSDPVLRGELNTHRVVEIKNGGAEFVTKGDNNPLIDEQTARAEDVIGIYSRHLPFLSVIGRFLSTSTGITVMALLIFAIIIAVFLPDVLAFLRNKAKNEQFDELVKAEVERLKSENADSDNDSKQ